MKIRKTNFLLVFSAFIAMTSCGRAGGEKKSVCDTLVQPDTPVVAEPTYLPDTVYESARSLMYTVDVADTMVSGSLASTDDMYESVPGALTFRCGARRDADFGGHIAGEPSAVTVDWTFKTGEDYTPTKYGAWGGGTGWTGQPLYINWPDSCMTRFVEGGVMNSEDSSEEIILGSLAGKIYFIDYNSGKESRSPIDVGNPLKGTVSLDPTLNGNLYVGHGVPGRGSRFGAEVIDLNRHERSHFFGPDSKAHRGWNAYDSSPVRVGQFLFRLGENGTLYKFLISPGSLKLHSALRYRAGGVSPGMEASMSVYRNYGYVADNGGNVICVNLETLVPVWRYKLPDDTDSTPVVAEEADGVYVYTGCEVEHAGVTEAAFVKLDALTGREVWVNRMPAQRKDVDSKHFDGGYYATALPGEGNCSHLIFANCVANTDGQNGYFVAFDRSTGTTVYKTPLKYYAWSSPVGFLNDNGQMYVFTADCAGNVYLIDGVDGRILYKTPLGANFESSPVVIGNHVVIGSRGNTIYKLSIQ